MRCTMSCSNVGTITGAAVIVILQSLSQNGGLIHKASGWVEATTGNPGVGILGVGGNNGQS